MTLSSVGARASVTPTAPDGRVCLCRTTLVPGADGSRRQVRWSSSTVQVRLLASVICLGLRRRPWFVAPAPGVVIAAAAASVEWCRCRQNNTLAYKWPAKIPSKANQLVRWREINILYRSSSEIGKTCFPFSAWLVLKNKLNASLNYMNAVQRYAEIDRNNSHKTVIMMWIFADEHLTEWKPQPRNRSKEKSSVFLASRTTWLRTPSVGETTLVS